MISIFLSMFQSMLVRELAYLDPGTGSFLIQLLIGAVVGAALFVKTYWQKIKGFFSKKQVEAPQADGEGAETTSDAKTNES